MGAAMLSGVVGIENKTIKNSASYISIVAWKTQGRQKISSPRSSRSPKSR
jgi:hypothetical protein